MPARLSRFVNAAVMSTALAAPLTIFAQVPAGSSARDIPTAVQQSEDLVNRIIGRSEDHFRKGKLYLEDSKLGEARDEFDRAVDSILESGFDVRASQKLQTFYFELVERIYREEVPAQQSAPRVNSAALVAQNVQGSSTQSQKNEPQRIGFHEQKFEPSPLDELSKLILTPEEQNVSSTDVSELELARRNVDFSFTINPLIQQYINYYQGRGRSTMEAGLRRSGQFMKLARQTFNQEGVPIDLVWLGQVESAWRVKAVSWAAASGLWQFVPGTGRQYKLRQTAWIDERNSIEQSTRASAKYLKDLGSRYNGNWELAMAAYNTGAGNVDRAISRAGTASFWEAYPYLAQETRNYVPNILAVILIAKNPEKYGFKGIRPDAPLSYDRVEVKTATSLQLIADATDSALDDIRALNPELKRELTPRGDNYVVRVPPGRAKQLVSILSRIPGDRRETARLISVAPGEDWQSVASRSGFSAGQLQAINAGVELKSTTKLVLPGNNIRLTNWRRAKPETDSQAARLTTIRARKGDTIARIASARKLDVNQVARLNGVPANAALKAGQLIKLPAAVPLTGRK